MDDCCGPQQGSGSLLVLAADILSEAGEA